jgi:hypothetical protein
LATFRLRSARSPIGRSKSVIETTRSGTPNCEHVR